MKKNYLSRVLILILCMGNVVDPIKAEGTENREYVISTWNIGHFSKGKKPYPTIDSSSYNSNYEELFRVIKDSLRAYIICLNEYSTEFCSEKGLTTQPTNELFFEDYSFYEIGPLMGFSCNVIFSKKYFSKPKLRYFDISKTVAAKMPRAANYYYLESDLYIDDVRVKLICSHTTSDAEALCQSQIAELLNRYRDCDRVIMCGDWNTEDFSLFINSGYQLANDGSMKSFPCRNKDFALDNIVVKGVKIKNAHMVKSTISDHYPIVCRIVVK